MLSTTSAVLRWWCGAPASTCSVTAAAVCMWQPAGEALALPVAASVLRWLLLGCLSKCFQRALTLQLGQDVFETPRGLGHVFVLNLVRPNS